MAAQIRFDLTEMNEELTKETDQLLVEVANELVNQLKIEAPVGATGDLRRSFQLFTKGRGRVLLGSRLSYALPVQTGTGPHVADFEALQVWARRVLGSEAAAGPVWRKIAQEGTDANPYMTRAIDNTVDQFR